MIEKEKLDMMVDFAMKLRTRQAQPNYSKRVHKILVKSDINHRLYCYMVDLMGYSSFMQIASGTHSTRVFRGDKSPNNLAQLVCDFDYHYGSGAFGNGIYLTTNKDRALDYTPKNNESHILTLSLSNDISLIGEQKLIDLYLELLFFKKKTTHELQPLVDYIYSLDRSVQRTFLRFLLTDYSKIALVLGYDGIVINPSDNMLSDKNYCIFNRGKLQITENELSRICNLSKNYHGGTIDFESKSADEFLRE